MKNIVLYENDFALAVRIQKRLAQNGADTFETMRLGVFLKRNPEEIDRIAVEWDIRNPFIQSVLMREANMKVVFYNESFLADIDESTEMDRILRQALSDKNWKLCKSINEFYMMGDIIRKRKRQKALPMKLQMESTDLCNARCIMCSHAYQSGSGVDLLRSGILDRLASILPFLRVVVLHGNGEPFLKKDISAYLEFLSSYGIKFIANTNLSILDKRILDRFREDFLELNISCDGHNKELYESIRCGLQYESFIENVRKVRAECPDLTMKMSVVVMRQNMEHLSDLVEFAGELGFDEIMFNQLCTDPKNHNLEDAPYLYPEKYEHAINAAIVKAREKHIGIRIPHFTAEAVEQREETSVKLFSGICDWLVEGPYINLQGNVGICCINQNVIMGNVFESSFEEIWNGEQYQNIRSCFYEGSYMDYCRGCDFILHNRLQFMNVNTWGQCDPVKRVRQ